MAISIIEQAECYRLIRHDEKGFAVIECCGNHVYSLDPHHSKCAEDTPEGMNSVVGEDGWEEEDHARSRFKAFVRGERHWAKTIW